MWTHENRPKYNSDRLRYPSDLTDDRPGKFPQACLEWQRARLAFVEALGLTHVDLLGFSLGGMVAQEMALQHPSLVHKMLLVGTSPGVARTSRTWKDQS